MERPAAYFREVGDKFFLGNEFVEFGFDEHGMGALGSIVDKRSGCEFLRDASAPAALYRLALRRADDRSLEWLESNEAAVFDWRPEADADGVTLILTTRSFPGRELEVTVEIRLEGGSALSSWRMAVRNAGEATVYQLTCPIVSGLVKVGESVAGETIVFPRQGEGFVFRDPFPVRDRLPLCAGAGPGAPDVGIGDLHGLYPGRIPMQMFAYHNDQAGLYFGTHDAGQHVKSFDVAPMPGWGSSPVFSISHLPTEVAGKEMRLPYETVVGVFHGDWYAAADIYKAWATKQWWCEKKLWERDIPDWMRTGFGVFQMSNYHMPKLKMNHPMAEIAGAVNALSNEIAVPLLGLVFNWEGGGAWTGPSGLFPPREGEVEFKEAMASLREAGNYGFVYITGGCWYLEATHEPPFNSEARFRTEAEPCAVMKVDGSRLHNKPGGFLRAARLCPHTECTKELTAAILVQCLDHGCTVVQIDNFPLGSSEECHDPSHGHPLGHGSWWSEAWGEILAETRRRAKAKNPDCAIATEGISENFIPWLEMFDHRAGNAEYWGNTHYRRGDPMGGEMIPLFSYVYHEYIAAYSAAMPECNRPEVVYWTRCLGKSLAQGVVPTGGKYFPEPAELNPVTIGFYKKIIRAGARECWPYLMFGEMLRPPEIDVPMIVASYCMMSDDADHVDPQKRHEVCDRAVEHSAWRGRDGTIGYLFANVSEEPVDFDVDLSAYGAEAPAYDVERITDGECEKLDEATALPRRLGITMAPLSVTLVRISEHHTHSKEEEQ